MRSVAVVSQRVALIVTLLGSICAAHAQAQAPNAKPANRYQDEKRQANANVVTIMASQAATPYTTLAEDLQNVLDDTQEGGLRVVPSLGRGGGQNLLDILFLKGVDMGLIEQDAPAYFKKKDPKLFADVEQRVQYIAKISNSELHVFVRKDINTLADLRGKKVSFHKQLSSSAIAAETLFNLAGVEVDMQYMDTNISVQKLKAGEIFAMVRVSGAPHPAFKDLNGQDGHFLPITAETLPPGAYAKLMKIYLPATLKNEHYPDKIPSDQSVATLSNATVLAVYGWQENSERYRRLQTFVKRFFDNIDKLRDGPRHPKWKEINIAANVAGWTRFKPAQQWLDASRPSPRASDDGAKMKAAFEEFLHSQPQSEGRQLTAQEKSELLSSFAKWWKENKTGKTPQ